ncbi:MAG: hypothetical protein QOJ90_2326 [Actinomycetota bacterium]|jgi:MinD-like ATPase involved in chromosome partitioning or flagellar assembly|nr:hypothetical protein [Actinomycetota bacterium]
MARYDGSSDAFTGFRDLQRDLNLDQWPDVPDEDVPPEVAPAAPHDHTETDGGSPAPSWQPGERVVDLRDPDRDGPRTPWQVAPSDPAVWSSTDPAGWSPSYDSGFHSSYTLDVPLPPLPPDIAADPVAGAAPESTVPETDRADELAAMDDATALAGSGGHRRHAAPDEPGPEESDVTAQEPEETTTGGAVTQLLAAVEVRPFEHMTRAEPMEHTGWNIPPAPLGPSLRGAESLTASSIIKARRARPQSGWRKGVYSMTRGKVNLGLSRSERRRAALVAAARTPVNGCHRVAVISLKGGVGKTTTTAALGSMFAMLRGDRVIAMDANPDRGTLGERIPRESGATVRHLLEARHRLTRYADVRHFTSQSSTRLEVLASDADPSASLAFGEQDYRDTVTTLERFYNLILTDCGTGLLHSAMHGILTMANSLVVVSSPSLDGARSASATLDWLEAHGLEDLAQDAVVVISSVRAGGGMVDVMQLEEHFAARCRAVVSIPYDPHLETGGELEIEELADDTREAYYELAAAVAEGFSRIR